MGETKQYLIRDGAPGYIIEGIVTDLRKEMKYVAEKEGSNSISKWFRLGTTFIPEQKELEAVLQTLGQAYWPDTSGLGGRASDQSSSNYSKHKVHGHKAKEFKDELRKRIETIIRIESVKR